MTARERRVAIVSGDPLLCRLLAAVLGARGFEIAGTADTEAAGARVTSRTAPDVVLAALELRSGSGLGLARRLHGRAPVVIVTEAHEGEVVLDVVRAGGAGCVSHAAGLDAVAACITAAGPGGFALGPGRLAETLEKASLEYERVESGPAPLARLTAREQEILELIAGGLGDPDIAAALHLSAHTVRTHAGNILRKLGVHSRADAVRLVLRHRTGAVAGSAIVGPDLGDR